MPKGVYQHHSHQGFQKGHSPLKGFEKGCFQKGNKVRLGMKYTEESKRKMRDSHKGIKLSKNHCDAISKSNKGNPKIIKAVRKLWQDSDYVRKQMKVRHVIPNKTEKFLERFLNKILPSEYKFVGDGEFILGGKCPDFLNINGKKRLIELYGNYWHKDDNPQDRISYFKRYGYDTLVIWESELQNLLKLKEKILLFKI